MIDKTVLELVDRLVATANKATKAESKVDDLTAKLVAAKEDIDKATTQINWLNERITDMEKQLMEKNDSVAFWYNEARKAEAKLEKGKHEEETDDKT